jgi:putative endonuclease
VKPPPHGSQADESVYAYLTTQGVKALQRSYRCGTGEIDLIMQDGEFLLRGGAAAAQTEVRREGLASVDHSKRGKLAATVRHYALTHASGRIARFDVVAINAGERIAWVCNAFEA